MKVKVISLPYIFKVLYVLCFTRPRYQVSVYRTIGPLVTKCFVVGVSCRNLYSFVVYLYVYGSGSITSVGEVRANFSAVVYL